jgi:hypothetical protein
MEASQTTKSKQELIINQITRNVDYLFDKMSKPKKLESKRIKLCKGSYFVSNYQSLATKLIKFD